MYEFLKCIEHLFTETKTEKTPHIAKLEFEV